MTLIGMTTEAAERQLVGKKIVVKDISYGEPTEYSGRLVVFCREAGDTVQLFVDNFKLRLDVSEDAHGQE